MMGKPMSAGLIATLAVSAILPCLLDFGYRVSDFETVAISTAAAVLGLAAGWALSSWPRAIHVLISFMVYWIIDAYFASQMWILLLASTAAVAMFAALQSRFAANMPPMLIAFSVLWISSNLLSPSKEVLEPALASAANSTIENGGRLPPIIHFIMDEQMSPEALPETIPDGGHPASQILRSFQDRGFDTFVHVRSVSHLSRVSIGNLLSLQDNSKNFREAHGDFSFSVLDNRYFDALAAKGYIVNAIQSDYFGICDEPVRDRCQTYSRAGSSRAVADHDYDFETRIKLALIDLHSRLSGPKYSGGVAAYGLFIMGLRNMGVPLDSPEAYTRPISALNILDQISRQLEDAQRGNAYVYHLLLPHTPYILNADCTLKSSEDWTRGIGDILHDKPIDTIYAGYWDQAACANERLMGIIDKVLASKSGADAIIMVHGDHGARLTWEGAKTQDSTDMLETLLVIRQPGSNGKTISERMTLQVLFKDIVQNLLGKT